MQEVHFADRARIPDRVLARELDGEAVLLDLATDTYFGLNRVGARMWTLVTTSPSIGDAYRVLAEEYAVAPERLRADLAAFVGELVRRGLLEVSGA